jgi:hypothetical protein
MAKVVLSYAKKEEIPAALVDMYVEQEDGSFKLDADIEDVTGLKSALKKERDLVKDLRKKIKVDITPEELDDLREKAEAVNDSEEVKKLIKANKKMEGELANAQTRITKLTTKLGDVMLKSDAKTAIGDAEGEEEVLLPHVLGRAALTEEDDDFIIAVKDAAGEPLMKAGKPGTLADVVAELKAKPQFAGAFKGTGASGSGARQTVAGSGTRSAEAGTATVDQKSRDAKVKSGNYSF